MCKSIWYKDFFGFTNIYTNLMLANVTDTTIVAGDGFPIEDLNSIGNHDFVHYFVRISNNDWQDWMKRNFDGRFLLKKLGGFEKAKEQNKTWHDEHPRMTENDLIDMFTSTCKEYDSD